METVREWYNVIPDLPVEVPPPINSEGGDELGLFQRIAPKGLVYLNTSKRARHRIPADVLDCYRDFGRPTPLVRARRLEAHLRTPARIYLKREDFLPSGSFKLNTSIAQAARAREEGYEGVVTETGAGQWGLSLCMAGAIYGLRCRVFQARCSFEQKPQRRLLMELYGGEVLPSPSDVTAAGRAMLAHGELRVGSIGTAISEAVEFARESPQYAYVAGSNLLHVYIHQSVIGIETARQLRAQSEEPDVLVASVGGGSNLAGFALPMAYGPEAFSRTPELLACESAVIPRLTRGEYRYDHGDPAGLTPLVKSYTLGRGFIPPPTHVGGLRQHNGSPVVGALLQAGLLRAKAYSEPEVFAAGRLLARLEGILAAPETCHALAGVLDAAREAKEQGVARVIVACVSGSGALDLAGYEMHGG